MEGYTTRRATSEGDVALLTALEAAAFHDAWGEDAIRSHVCSENGITLLCLDRDGRAVGYLFGTSLPPEGELYRIAVVSEERKKGIGRFILLRFLDILDKNGADVCFLEVRESNTAARALYALLGFKPVGLRKNYYKDPLENALVLKRGEYVPAII